MKRFIAFFFAALLIMGLSTGVSAQVVPGDNSKADSIVGEYSALQNGVKSKVRFTKKSDGTYKCQVFWADNSKDASGKPNLDVKNPDKSLRNTPVDQVVLIDGLKYDAEKKVWNGTKVYDPTRGIKANVTITFDEKGKLKLRGTVLGIGETAIWEKLK